MENKVSAMSMVSYSNLVKKEGLELAHFVIVQKQVPGTVKLGIKELFGHRTIVHYLLSELAYWSWEMVHYCHVVHYLAVP